MERSSLDSLDKELFTLDSQHSTQAIFPVAQPTGGRHRAFGPGNECRKVRDLYLQGEPLLQYPLPLKVEALAAESQLIDIQEIFLPITLKVPG